jgi:hypothetical protein
MKTKFSKWLRRFDIFGKKFENCNMTSESAQEIFEYSRRGMIADLLSVLGKAHPDDFVAYDGSTSFHMACKGGHHKICDLLLMHGADASLRTEDGSTALILASAV